MTQGGVQKYLAEYSGYISVNMAAPSGVKIAEFLKVQKEIETARKELKNIRQELTKINTMQKKDVTKILHILNSENSKRFFPGNRNVPTETEKTIESDSTFSMQPIGYISSCHNSKNGTPRQPSVASYVRGQLKLNKSLFTNPHHSLKGLEDYSHIWIIFVFHQNVSGKAFTKAKIKPPRLDGASIGVFACRSPFRPNAIGLTLAKIEGINDSTIEISGIDMIDGTPVLDIKPFIPAYDAPKNTEAMDKTVSLPGESSEINSVEKVTIPEWISHPSIQELSVIFTDRTIEQLKMFHKFASHEDRCCYCLKFLSGWQEAKQAIADVLQADPRSPYRRNKCQDRLYYFDVDSIHVTCWFDENVAEILKVKPNDSYS